MRPMSRARASGYVISGKIRVVCRNRLPALVCACVVTAGAFTTAAQEPDPLSALNRTIALAEESLRTGERQIAESRYRTALQQAWMILGALHVSSGQLADARQAFERASSSAVENDAAQQSLAIIQIQMGDSGPALDNLTRMVSASPRNVQIRRTLAQGLASAGRPAEAVQELEAAHAIAPEDPELMFALASGYLRLKKVDAAESLFAKVTKARPLPETYVLIGRTYRDFGYYDRARAALQEALKMDPRTRRAHYYLGTTAVMEEGVLRMDQAISEFHQELKIAPGDPPTTLKLGMALVEARQYAEALPRLEAAVTTPSAPVDAFLYLGRCQLGLGRAGEAVKSLKQALDVVGATTTASTPSSDDPRLGTIHYHLGMAYRQVGAGADAQREFASAERLSARRTETDRAQLADYMADRHDQSSSNLVAALPIDVAVFDAMTPGERTGTEARIRPAIARTYLNLGIMLAQGKQFARAAELFESAAGVDPAFPQLQYSLGVAYFNAQVYDKAAAGFGRALEQRPGNPDIQRMLALASLNAEDYARAAELLQKDPKLSTDPSLLYAYGIALVRSDRAQEAEEVFTRILAQHPDVPELNVIIGQAHAAQGDYDAAVAALRRALELKRDVAEANAALGGIYLRQGQLGAAADALRAELAAHPDDVRSRNTLATVLDLDGRSDEALKELRTIIAARPTYADARYLFGKILLAQGSAEQAAEHLEVAARIAPDDANVHYQLGQAYQRLGRTELAAREFEAFKRLKDKRRGGTP
jgi:tetratricopeptide (TPR) repeat protein